MIYNIRARNVNDAYVRGCRVIAQSGIERDSRNGPTFEIPGPVATTYERPQERVLFDQQRDANPFFHLFESFWMLTGGNDLEFPQYFNARFGEYAEADGTIHGAYGYRWRRHFKRDQIAATIDILKNNPDDRRAVIDHWDVDSDLGALKRDIPCNTTIYLRTNHNYLNMTVCCRSNDMIWGAYGANVVHFSILQEYLASMCDMWIGEYHQFSNSFHVYTNIWSEKKDSDEDYFRAIDSSVSDCPYKTREVSPLDLVTDRRTFHRELTAMVARMRLTISASQQPLMMISGDYKNRFLVSTAWPMFIAWYYHKQRDYTTSLMTANMIEATDWKKACVSWLLRRKYRWERRASTG